MEALSKPELLALLSVAKAASKRDWLMILVGYWHGLRASEVVGLTPSSIADGCVTVARLKGSMKTTQPLPEHADPLLDLRSELIEYIRGMHPNQTVFPISRTHFWRLVKKYSALAGIPKRLGHPHILKHSLAMQTIKSAGIENLRQYLGHKSLASTGAYLKVDDMEASRAVTGSGLKTCEFKQSNGGL
jgi:integrase/recombinase XerD